ncbi:gamma-glutamyltransferase [Paraliomyxa miuraensis]|uniref:gamma-glutamyltransferase n=1 Tax=Paraliomyxa miuraensis TaxID=376150 RepID=UPI0022530A36|nr:gamma-glutamyltransferase [Paraliomyxa miuraensis]MCX4247928.1 gamma-glutamyltransferase family protein [Paraliomyxa miuraensis]
MVTTAGVIAAGDERTAEAGAQMLREGGNAVDAICAAALTAFVAEAPLCGPGGAGVLLAGTAERMHVLDAFAEVPGRGLGRERSVPLHFHEVTVDFGGAEQVFHVGRGAVAVPGILLGLWQAHERLGRLPREVMVAPAVAAGREGCQPSEKMLGIIEIIRPIITLTPATAALFFDEHGAARLANPRLADFLEALAREGEPLWRASLGKALVEACGPQRGGLLTAADVAAYAPVWREPLRSPWGDDVVLTNPPPSSGGSLVTLGLRLASGPASGLALHELPWLGPRYATEVAALLSAIDRAKAHTRGDPLDDAAIEIARRTHERRRPLGSTTHLSVLDGEGMVAALTMTTGEGCGVTLEEFGIHLNNLLGEEDINPRGFHTQPAGTWMTTMMAPTAVLHRGRPSLVLGTGGSNRIRSALLQTLLHVLAHGRSLEEAVIAPRMHVEGDRLWLERQGLPEGTEDALRGQWAEVTALDRLNIFFGGVHAVGFDGALHGAGDPRRGGVVRRVG